MSAATSTPSPVEFTVAEQMVCRIASEMDESGVTVLGSFTPLAYASYMLAKLTHAPDAYLVGYNALGMRPVELAFMGAEAAAYKGATARWGFISLVNVVHLANRGNVEAVSSAQIDQNASINLSVIGDYERPKVRLPGGVGAPEVVQNYRTMLAYFGRHDRRVLTAKVDFATGGRFPISAPARAAQGLQDGPVKIITPMAVLVKRFDDRPFAIESIHGGASVADVVDATGFELEVPDEVPPTAEPTAEQVRLLREHIDPYGTIQFDLMSGAQRMSYLREVIDREWARAEAALRERG
jgi:acyl CoA:acetate/3-ketoacid CoA transferase beta subunit